LAWLTRMRSYSKQNRNKDTNDGFRKNFLKPFLRIFVFGKGEIMNEQIQNPYVMQVDKLSASLKKLSEAILKMEESKDYYNENTYQKVKEEICVKCDNFRECGQKDGFKIRQMLYEVFCVAEDYGAELNVEFKRGIQGRCTQAPRFLRKALDEYGGIIQEKIWSKRIEQNRESCALQLNSFAGMIQHATKELDACIFSDEHLEKKLKTKFAKYGLKFLSSVFLVSKEGRYEIHVTTKATRGHSMTTSDVAELVSDCVGRRMVPAYDERPSLGEEYCTIVCVEEMQYYVLQGVARIGKGCEKISGDSFSIPEVPGGKKVILLSDGMGAGEMAEKESTLTVELLEELLEAGFLRETALQMLNTAMVMGREEVRFSTIDMSVFDLYTGKCELVKAGASITFIRREDRVEVIKSESLPLGVVSRLEPDFFEIDLEPGDLIVMVTDGIMDALPIGQQELLMKQIIGGCNLQNLKEMANHILRQVLEFSGQAPMDDMTVLVAGIWSLEK